MRPIILAAAAALGLAGCGSEEQANNTVNIDQAVLSQELSANDVTAIDAVTADASNMAADVDIAFTNDMTGGDGGGNQAAGDTRRPRSRNSADRPEPADRTAAAPVAKSAEPATSNAAGNATE